MTIDVPEDYVGVVTQLLALRKGRMEHMVNHGTGWVRLDYARARARADRLPHRVPHRDARHRDPPPRLRRLGALGRRAAHAPDAASLVADRRGTAAPFALMNLQERGTLFVGPGEEVYEGMIVGENARADDLDVNATKEKQLTNIRSSTSEVLVRLVPHRQLSLDQALEFLREDECVEVTPERVRLRKVILERTERVKAGRRARANAAPV